MSHRVIHFTDNITYNTSFNRQHEYSELIKLIMHTRFIRMANVLIK